MGAWTPPSGTTPNSPARADDHATADLLAEDPVRRAHVVLALGVIVAAFRPSPCSRIAAAVVDDLVLRRPPVVERKVVAVEARCRARSRPGSRTSASSRATPVGLVPLEDGDPRSWHASDPMGVGTRLAWRGEGAGPEGPQGASGTSTDAESGSPIPKRSSGSRRSSFRLRGGTSGSRRARSEAQATGVDRAGRRQYLYHPEFRASGSARSSTSSSASPSACPTASQGDEQGHGRRASLPSGPVRWRCA